MERIAVTSSNINSVGYDLNSMTLEIEFHSGSIYQYFDVPESEYHNLISADSVGSYFHRNIKNIHRYVKL